MDQYPFSAKSIKHIARVLDILRTLHIVSGVRLRAMCIPGVPGQVFTKAKQITMKTDANIKVQIHYMAAAKPYKAEWPPSTTVNALKAAAMTEFGLTEDDAKKYPLYYKKQELTNPSQTLTELADDHKNLNLQLEEVLIQGS